MSGETVTNLQADVVRPTEGNTDISDMVSG